MILKIWSSSLVQIFQNDWIKTHPVTRDGMCLSSFDFDANTGYFGSSKFGRDNDIASICWTFPNTRSEHWNQEI